MQTKRLTRLVVCLVLGVVSVSLGCKRRQSDGLTTAELIWKKSQYEYKTNEVRTAYPLIMTARNQLSEMWKANQGGLDYPYCLAVLNGRLFVMAKALGQTNDANRFFVESSICWNQVRRELRLEPTNYTAEHIEAMIAKQDAGLSSTNPHCATEQ